METKAQTHTLPTLPTLPREVLQAILLHLPPTSAVALSLTCRTLASDAREPLLWRLYCLTSWRKWDRVHDLGSVSDWRALFAQRARTRSAVRQLVRQVIGGEPGRIGRLEAIVKLGWDGVETLLEGLEGAGGTEDELARRYWNHVAFQCACRAAGVEELQRQRFQDQRPDSMPRSFAAMDLFVLPAEREGDIEEIDQKLLERVAAIRRQVPGIDRATPHDKATLVAQYLLDRGLVGIREGRDYHNIEHSFLGVALFSTHHNSLPIVTAVIYCEMLRHLGIRASPCNYPGHIFVVVRPPPGLSLSGEALRDASDDDEDSQALYMNPFETSTPVPVSYLRQTLPRLDPTATTPSAIASYLTEASPRTMAVRCARNIISSLRLSRQDPLSTLDRASATYAAFWTLISFPTHPDQLTLDIVLLMSKFVESFTTDVGLIENYILPLTVHMSNHALFQKVCWGLRRTDELGREPKRREGINLRVRHKIGMVFRHRRYAYLGVITGWDHMCLREENWIKQTGADRLPNGRSQPFYHVLGKDQSTRYVADENIEIITIDKEVAASFSIEIGKYFKRWDDERKMFINNQVHEYPDD